jgi:hypothetical protein
MILFKTDNSYKLVIVENMIQEDKIVLYEVSEDFKQLKKL